MTFTFPFKVGVGIEQFLSHVSHGAIQLVYLMCTYDPDERINAQSALRHSYFKDLRYLFYLIYFVILLVFYPAFFKHCSAGWGLG